MLIRFSVENYRSFNERQIFTMAAGKQSRHKNHIVLANGKRVLKGGILFGANASGKSNLIKAINFGKNIVFSGVNAGNTINRNFRVDSESVTRPGVFQYDIFKNNHFYSYGFAISYLTSKIISEWLYLIDDDKEVVIFERDETGKISTDIKYKDEEIVKRFEIYSEDVEDNKTFLIKMASTKLREYIELKPYFDVCDWFKSLIIVFPQTKFDDIRQFLVDDSLESVGRLLKFFDTGIESLSGAEKPIEETLSFLPEHIRNSIIEDVQNSYANEEKGSRPQFIELTVAGRRISCRQESDGTIFASQLVMNHGNQNDMFDLVDESDGTRRLFDLIPLYKKGRQDCVIIVDELDRSFHTKLTIEYIQKFYERTLGANSQLIVTLHDSNVMNLNLLRQDEIWFVERKEDHSTEIYSLSKFKERFDHSVAKDYLLGRYGAVPNFGVDPWEEEV